MLWVTSSPISPLPRVAPRSNTPSRYSSDIARPSIFGSATNSNSRVLDPLAREVVAHPLDPGGELLGGADVGERQHRLRVADLDEVGDRLAADALSRRVRRDAAPDGRPRSRAARRAARRRRRRRSRGRRGRSSGSRGARAGRAARPPARRPPRASPPAVPIGIGLGGHRPTALARGGREQPRQVVRDSASSPAWSVRSKCSGVTAIRPAATAARSVSDSPCSRPPPRRSRSRRPAPSSSTSASSSL